ncbi:uncharacterized protein LOC129575859 [Sitodiplosis mosellana]|uniref:uncharacterized protein LOC129575859 n=1 Tax=Sitodiplosis mosellana TaxID=263140 RepID=UPI002443F5A2|nr:uncharacterized protein LOC129575859 [Sitodiplosis mosellana]
MESESKKPVWIDPNPVEILEHIFRYVEDSELMRLKDVTERFESVVKTTFKDRYKTKDFKVRDDQRVHCEELIAFIGNYITGIEAISMENIDKNHWFIQLLNQHSIKLDRIIFGFCKFNNMADALKQQLSLTQFAIRHSYNFQRMDLPEFRNLTSLKIDDCEFTNYLQIIQNNPQLQRLSIKSDTVSPLLVFESVGRHCNQLEELHVSNDEALVGSINMSKTAMERLHTLSITIDSDSVEVLKEFSAGCKNLTDLMLEHNEGSLSEKLVRTIGSFSNIKALKLMITDGSIHEYHVLTKSLGKLPNLAHLCLRVDEMEPMYDFLLSLLRECKQINRVEIRTLLYSKHQIGINKGFHDELLDIVQHRTQDVTIQIGVHPRYEAFISKTKIIWRNMLVHWVGYDPVLNRSNTHLLQLADVETSSAKDDGDDQWKQQPFQKILSYLDTNSLYALYQTSQRCRQLVKIHVKKRFEEKGELFIANKYEIDENALRAFGQYMSNIEVIFDRENVKFWELINTHCGSSVRSLAINDMREVGREIFEGYFNFPNLRHLKYISIREIQFNIYYLRGCHQLETLEFSNDVGFKTFGFHRNELKSVKKITFLRRTASTQEFVHLLDKYTPNIERRIVYSMSDQAAEMDGYDNQRKKRKLRN